MNPKLKKLCGDIEKTREKIADLQDKLRELEQQKTEVENTDIVALFRSVSITPDELAGFIQRYKAESAAPAPARKANDDMTGETGQEEQEDSDDE